MTSKRRWWQLLEGSSCDECQHCPFLLLDVLPDVPKRPRCTSEEVNLRHNDYRNRSFQLHLRTKAGRSLTIALTRTLTFLLQLLFQLHRQQSIMASSSIMLPKNLKIEGRMVSMDAQPPKAKRLGFKGKVCDVLGLDRNARQTPAPAQEIYKLPSLQRHDEQIDTSESSRWSEILSDTSHTWSNDTEKMLTHLGRRRVPGDMRMNLALQQSVNSVYCSLTQSNVSCGTQSSAFSAGLRSGCTEEEEDDDDVFWDADKKKFKSKRRQTMILDNIAASISCPDGLLVGFDSIKEADDDDVFWDADEKKFKSKRRQTMILDDIAASISCPDGLLVDFDQTLRDRCHRLKKREEKKAIYNM